METKELNVNPGSNESWDEKQSGNWLKPVHKERITSVMTKYFHQVSPQWGENDSERVVNIVEKLVYRTIDVGMLNRTSMSKDGFTFSFNVVQNMYSDELLDLLNERRPCGFSL